MVDITLVELHVEDGSFSTTLPFSGISSAADDEDTQRDDEQEAAAEDDEGGSGKGLALLGVLVLLVIGTAVVKYLTGEDEQPEVAVETDEESPTITAE
ncbi:hypothetical protein [Halovenus sp. HT40]|uniref:hypothetical protein n=1 Tax=Halovenus sp. HT40 TaxID=3126691 RepID=UPI00300EA612